MKKLLTLITALVLCMGLMGCREPAAVESSEVFAFPEPTYNIVIICNHGGDEIRAEFGNEESSPESMAETAPVINWFHGLKLRECNEPEPVEGSAYYEFKVNDKFEFGYDDRGGNESYVLAGGQWYEVINPSTPPFAARNN